jgi:hypothetical protein
MNISPYQIQALYVSRSQHSVLDNTRVRCKPMTVDALAGAALTGARALAACAAAAQLLTVNERG